MSSSPVEGVWNLLAGVDVERATVEGPGRVATGWLLGALGSGTAGLVP